MTNVADGAAVASAFPRGRQLILANSFHVNALPRARSDCAADIARRFVTRLDPGDTSCIASVPVLRLAADFAAGVAQVDPAAAQPGNAANEPALRCANAALQTAGDVVSRLHSNASGHGVGLRGGTFTIQKSTDQMTVRVRLNAVRWTNDLAISGEIDWGGQRSHVSAHLTFNQKGPCGAGDLKAYWPQIAANARAVVAGRIGQSTVQAETGAP